MRLKQKFGSLVMLLAAVSLVSYAPPAEAQFLKNLSKGLEKVNKAIKKVEEATKGKKNSNKGKKDSNSDKNKNSDARNEELTVQPEQNNQTVNQASAAAAKRQFKENKKKRKPLTPFLTWDTKVLNYDMYFDMIPEVSDGIFYITERNPELGGYSNYYGFWNIDGKRIFPPQYEQMSGSKGHPKFDSGACVMKEAKKKDAPIILYADGSTLPLSKDWKSISPFMNGVAMVEELMPAGGYRYFYINTKGKKIWPHLNDTYTTAEMVKATKLGGVYIRPLSDGRRAYFDRTARKWGFLDSNGKIVINAKFTEVRDFRNGYALVVVPTADAYNSRQVFIDKNGKEYATIPFTYSTVAPMHSASDVSNDIYAVRTIDPVNTHLTIYYDVKTGKELRRFTGGGSGFSDGYALVRLTEYANTVYVVNTSFNIVNKISDAHSDIILEEVDFKNFPWYTCNHKFAINNEAYVEMAIRNSNYDRLEQFSPDGFAKARAVFADPNDSNNSLEYAGYVDATGRFRIVFSPDAKVKGPFKNLPGPKPPYPIPPRDTIEDPVDPPYPTPPPVPPVLRQGDTIAAGPTGPGREALRYRVSVVAQPPQGGTVYGSGEYSLGDTLRVTGVPAKGYKISEITCDRLTSPTSTFNKFVVDGDMLITCYFVKEDTIQPIDNGVFSGPLQFIDYPLNAYVEIGNVDGNKYTNASNGVMAVLTSDNKAEISVHDVSEHAVCDANVFFAPMSIIGIMEENGKKYIRFDGGVIKYKMDVTDTTGWGFINNPFLMFAMAFDGAGKGELEPGMYRVEITEGSPEEGEFTLGMLERKSGRYGWLSSDDPSFTKKLPGFFTRRYDKGLPADYLAGARLKKGNAVTLQWEPSENFFGDPSLLESFAEALGAMYRKAVKSTILEDYDIWQFSNDLDKHIFKPM